MPIPYAPAGVKDGKATATCPLCGDVSTGTDHKAATRAYGEHYEAEHKESLDPLLPGRTGKREGRDHHHPLTFPRP